MMKGVLYSMITVTCAWIFCGSCDNSLANLPAQEKCPILLYASIGESTPTTRFTITQDTLIHLNETVYIWCDEDNNGSLTPVYDCWQTVSDGAGALNSVLPGTRYYPLMPHPFRFTGIHGNFHFNEHAHRPTIVSHNIKNNQTTQADYLLSDLLYVDTAYTFAALGGGSLSTHLRFHHMLSRIELCFQPYGSLTDDSLIGARVFIENVYPTAELNMTARTVTTTGTKTSIEVPLYTIPWAAPVSDFSNANYAEVIIPAQKVTPKEVLFRLQTAYGRDYYFVPDTIYTFEPGKRYRFNMLVKHHIKFGDMDEGSTITPWDGDIIYHEFSMEPIIIPPTVSPWGGLPDNHHLWTWIVPEPTVTPWSPLPDINKNWNILP